MLGELLDSPSGGAVFVHGEAGIGKSRLVRELTARAMERSVLVLAGRAAPARPPTPYRPLTEALAAASTPTRRSPAAGPDPHRPPTWRPSGPHWAGSCRSGTGPTSTSRRRRRWCWARACCARSRPSPAAADTAPRRSSSRRGRCWTGRAWPPSASSPNGRSQSARSPTVGGIRSPGSPRPLPTQAGTGTATSSAPAGRGCGRPACRCRAAGFRMSSRPSWRHWA